MQNSPLNKNHELPMQEKLQHQDVHRRKTKEIKHKNKIPRIPKVALTVITSILPSTPNTWRNAAEKALLWRLLLLGPVLCMSVPSTSKVINTLLAIARSPTTTTGASQQKGAKRRKLRAKNEIPIHPSIHPSIHPLNHPSIHIRIPTSVACCRWPQCEQGLSYPTNFSFQFFINKFNLIFSGKNY